MAQSSFSNSDLYLDGEQIPPARLQALYRQPPDLPPRLRRSTLLVGAKGAGKTTMLRYHKKRHEESNNGIALDFPLPRVFASIAKQAHSGPLDFDLSPDLHNLVAGMATSLLAIALAGECARRSLPIPSSELRSCLPQGLLNDARNSLDDPGMLFRLIGNSDLEDFEGLYETAPLSFLLEAISQQATHRTGPLMLLLDRAELVSYAALAPIFALLDQSASYTAIVSIRPGITHLDGLLAGEPVAGDHYDVYQLGHRPRDEAWIDFVLQAIEGQFPGFSVKQDDRELILTLARDSVRTGLELFARMRAVPRDQHRHELMRAIDDLKENQLTSAGSSLAAVHPEFADYLTSVRKAALGSVTSLPGPVCINVDVKADSQLLPVATKFDRLAMLALRWSLLCMPHGSRWIPGLRPRTLEIPPLLLWRRAENQWTYRRCQEITIPQRETDVFKGAGRPVKEPQVFVAYRFDSTSSVAFRRSFARALSLHPVLARLRVADGHVPVGAQWAKAIRSRITGSKLVVADVTGSRLDIMFELGFAWGLNKPIMPVVESPGARSILPSWLTSIQLGSYESRRSLNTLVEDVSQRIINARIPRFTPPPRAVPGHAVWFRRPDWATHAHSQFRTVLAQEGLPTPTIVDLPSDSDAELLPEEDLIEAAAASLLVACLDGTQGDAAVHFAAGAIAARPLISAGNRRLARRVLIIEDPEASKLSLVADSLRRCAPTVKLVELSSVRGEVQAFARSFKSWRR